MGGRLSLLDDAPNTSRGSCFVCSRFVCSAPVPHIALQPAASCVSRSCLVLPSFSLSRTSEPHALLRLIVASWHWLAGFLEFPRHGAPSFGATPGERCPG